MERWREGGVTPGRQQPPVDWGRPSAAHTEQLPGTTPHSGWRWSRDHLRDAGRTRQACVQRRLEHRAQGCRGWAV